ncbi:MAG: major capsid protein [Moraxella sp.]|nr:major capsid protein [Moraxella sp.]
MATTVNRDTIIYDELVQTAYLERLKDNLNVFNKASNGTIILLDEAIMGDFDKETLYKIGGNIDHRDVNATTAVEGKKISMGERIGVKVPFKYGPYESTEEAFKRRGRSVDEFSFLVGQDYADAVIAGYWKYATSALQGAIGSNTSMMVKAKLSEHGRKVITKGMRKFGDRFGDLSMLIMDADSYFDIVDGAITDKLYQEASTVVYGGSPGTMGIPVLVTDQAKDHTIYGLQKGAVRITNSQLPAFRAYPINDKENLTIGIRAEGAFNLDILGYSYKTTAGANPNLATLGATASWEKYATSNKNTAGVILDITED